MKESFELTEIFRVSPTELYAAWLDGDVHGQMTGGEAECSEREGDSFSTWDGYIWGKNLELVPNQKIVQSWRTSEFDEADADSILSIKLKELPDGTEFCLQHTNIPEGQTQYKKGWVDHYFTPMKAYFRS